MRTRTSLIAVAAAVTVAGLGVVAAPGTAGSSTKTVSGAGVGGVKVGASYERLRGQKLVGSLRRGCELGGPNTRSAKLLAPLKGAVDLTLTSPRKVSSILVTGGATARGVGIGAT